MVADGRPQNGLAQHVRKDIEHPLLVLLVRSDGVSIVAEHQPQVGLVAAGHGHVGVAHGDRAGFAGIP